MSLSYMAVQISLKERTEGAFPPLVVAPWGLEGLRSVARATKGGGLEAETRVRTGSG